MKETELKPCPFCGGCAVDEVNSSSKMFIIYCEDCPASMEISFVNAQHGDGFHVSFDEARSAMDKLTEAWNGRAYERKAD